MLNIFAERLKWLREKMKMTQKDMAERIGVSQQYYNKFEKGTGQPNLETLYKIRKVTGESLDFLIGYTFEDQEATLLYDVYSDYRLQREKVESDLQGFLDEDRFAGLNVEARMSMVSNLSEEVRKIQRKEDKALDMFMIHVSQLPGFTDEMKDRKYWIDQFYVFSNTNNEFFVDFYGKYKDMIE